MSIKPSRHRARKLCQQSICRNPWVAFDAVVKLTLVRFMFLLGSMDSNQYHLGTKRVSWVFGGWWAKWDRFPFTSVVRIGSGALGCAVMESGGKPDSLVKRFAGEGSNPPRDYKQWKRWARAYLKVQASRGMKEDAFGSVLYTLLDGAALRAFDAVDMNDIEQDGGQDVVFQVLDERYPEEASHDRLGEVLDAIFDLRIEKNETTATFTGKVKSAFSAAEAEGIRFPSVARGYMVLTFRQVECWKEGCGAGGLKKVVRGSRCHGGTQNYVPWWPIPGKVIGELRWEWKDGGLCGERWDGDAGWRAGWRRWSGTSWRTRCGRSATIMEANQS